MNEIIRGDINEEWAHSGYIEAGDFVFFNYCVGNVGKSVKEQIEGALDNMEDRLQMVDLSLENVVQIDALFKDVWNIPIMEEVFKNRFKGKYPVRKSISTDFAHNGLEFQIDGVAYKG